MGLCIKLAPSQQFIFRVDLYQCVSLLATYRYRDVGMNLLPVCFVLDAITKFISLPRKYLLKFTSKLKKKKKQGELLLQIKVGSETGAGTK